MYCLAEENFSPEDALATIFLILNVELLSFLVVLVSSLAYGIEQCKYCIILLMLCANVSQLFIVMGFRMSVQV